jgi:tetratricopeptide (TPR) repeat protein
VAFRSTQTTIECDGVHRRFAGSAPFIGQQSFFGSPTIANLESEDRIMVVDIGSTRIPARADEPGKPALGQRVLAHAQSSRDVVQDFVPLSESLEWELGQQYLRERGNKAFISDASPVPFVINNDGSLSRNAAEVFFTSLVEADKAGSLEPDLYVLELGIGVGLFARFFLDSLRELCQKHCKDYYSRLTYIAADRSPRMLHDVLRHGVLSQHPGRFIVRQVDAMEPQRLAGDVLFRERKGSILRAVFLNYLLDCLPASVLQLDDEVVRQLCVRTCVARNVRLADYTDMPLNLLQAKAKSADPRDRNELLEVYGLLASEYDYRPVDALGMHYGGFALDYGRKITKRLLHSHGAIQSLERLLELTHADGFVLVNDYGQTQTTREDEFEHQRFSLATFVGVNFPQLRAYFEGGKRCQVVEPAGDSRGIHSRLFSKRPASEIIACFYERFSDQAKEKLDEPIQRARACLKAGRFELAASYYREALDNQPRNWVLLNEISMFLTFQMRDPKAGIDMAKVALTLNPTCSADLWNTLGDGLYEFGRTAEARLAYLKAQSVNPTDVRSRYNLGWVYSREKNYPAALDAISQALALDKTGEFRERLLHKQQEVLGQLAVRHQHEYLLLINLVSKYVKSDDRKPAEPPKPAELPEKRD